MMDTLQRFRVAAGLALLLVSLAYLAQIASPLRLVGDGVDYLLQASSAADGHGFRVHGEQSMRPPGYPALIFLLVKGGIGKSWAIVALNCLLLGIGCWASYFVLRSSFAFEDGPAQVLCLLTLLSFVMVKHITYPLSDVCFFGASMPCLQLLLRAEADTGPGRYWRLAVAAPLLVFCIEVRTIGIALIPAFAWAMVGGAPWARGVPEWLRRHRIASLVLLLLVLAGMAWAGRMFLHSRYLQFNAKTLHRRGMIGNIVSDLKDHTQEWGELAVNVPVSKLPGGLALPVRIAGLSCAPPGGNWNLGKTPEDRCGHLVCSRIRSHRIRLPLVRYQALVAGLATADGVRSDRGDTPGAVPSVAAWNFRLLPCLLLAWSGCAWL